MKRKIFLVFLSVLVLVGLFFVLRKLIPYKATELEVPVGIVLDDYVLSWATVEGAEGYQLDVGGELRTVKNTSCNLRYSDNGKTIRVRALGDGYAHVDSDFSNPYVIVYADDISSRVDLVRYVLTEAHLTITEFVYKNMPVPTDAFDYSPYGYEFISWYRIVDGQKIPVTADFFHDGNVYLYANVRAIEYPISFVEAAIPLPSWLPGVYTVETLPEILSAQITSDGYKIGAWYSDAELENQITEHTLVTGELTLYPRISLINEGLQFEKVAGGYAVTGYFGNDKEIHVPSYYKGEPVIAVNGGALVGSYIEEGQAELSKVEKIVFHGSILLKKDAVGAFVHLKECVFLKDAVVEDGAIVFTVAHQSPGVSLLFYADVDIKTAFFAYYLGVEGDISFTVYVTEPYLSGCSEALSGVCEVRLFPLPGENE